MPRGKKDGHAVSQRGELGDSETAGGWRVGGFSSLPGVSQTARSYQAAFESLSAILARDDGWLRVVPQEAGEVAFWKWKFTRGSWRGYYVMVRMDKPDYAEPMWLLHQKLIQVDQGERRPSLDHPYGDDDA